MYDKSKENQTTLFIDNLIKKSLLPNYQTILEDQDPIPLYGLKLLSILVEKNPQLVHILKQMKLVDLLFSFFTRNFSPSDFKF